MIKNHKQFVLQHVKKMEEKGISKEELLNKAKKHLIQCEYDFNNLKRKIDQQKKRGKKFNGAIYGLRNLEWAIERRKAFIEIIEQRVKK